MAFKMKYEKGEGLPYKTDSPTRFLKGVGRKIRGAIPGALGGAFGGDNNLAGGLGSLIGGAFGKKEDKKSLSNISANNRKEIHKIDEEIEFLNEDVSSGVKTQQQIQAELDLLKSKRKKLMEIK